MPLFGPPNIEKLLAKRDVNKLIKALWHRDASVAKSAAEALGEIGAAAVPPLLAFLHVDNRTAKDRVLLALERIGAPAVEPLVAVLGDKDAGLRAVAALGKIGAPAVEPLLIALTDDDGNVRRRATNALGEIGAPAVEPLLIALTNDDRNVRGYATEALGEIGDVRALDPIAQVLKDESQDKYTRGDAAEALGKIGDSRAIEPLSAALSDDPWVRDKALRALEKLGVRPFSDFTIEEKRQLVKLSGPYLAGEKARRAGTIKVVDLSGVSPLVQRLSDRELDTLIEAESLMKKADASSGESAISLYLKVSDLVPWDEICMMSAAVECGRAGNWQEAHTWMLIATQRNPSSPRVKENMRVVQRGLAKSFIR